MNDLISAILAGAFLLVLLLAWISGAYLLVSGLLAGDPRLCLAAAGSVLAVSYLLWLVVRDPRD